MTNTYNTVNQPYNNVTYTITSGGGGGSGQILTTSGINGTGWTNTATSFTNSNNKSLLTIPYGKEEVILSEEASLKVEGKILINGLDLEERLKTIERVLAIPERDAKMESKYPSLKKKFDDYINTLEKYRTFERIKGDNE